VLAREQKGASGKFLRIVLALKHRARIQSHFTNTCLRSMVLNVSSLKHDLNLTNEDVESMRAQRRFYTVLEARRKQILAKQMLADSQAVSEAENDHYRTYAFKKALIKGTNRGDVVSFLYEMNGIGTGRSAFGGSGLKKKFLDMRLKRIHAHLASDRAEREATQKLLLEFKTGKADEARFHNENATHYEILDVPQHASAKEIATAFRRLAKVFHPDKRDGDEDAASVFRRLKEARDVLSCKTQRKQYDRMLAKKINGK